MNNYQMRFSGTGGQGMMLIGDLMAHYFGLVRDKQIILLKSYGPEARGGACRSELVVDEEECYPAVTRPDFMLCMSQKSYDTYTKDSDQDTVILVDEEFVKTEDSRFPKTYRLPLTRIAKEKTGKAICANITALGAITRLLQIDHDEMLEVIREKLPARILEVNLTAYEEGWKACGDLL
ncbi:MAG: 2-oxoacid:acceptor oxidoreductase family protein [Solobacterium sp.]|nr:2-oxoacid:acceptor oxidoreductase family protein [Solobacterium sp.]